MVELANSMSPNHRWTMAEYRRTGYMANGWNAVRKWNGRTTSAQLAGITGPSRETGVWSPHPTETSGDGEEGFRLYRYRYMDSSTGYVSPPSAELGSDLIAPVWDPAESIASAGTALRFLIGSASAVFGPHATGLNIAASASTLNGHTITRDSGSWIDDGFAVGDYITLANCENAGNNGTWGPIAAVTATVITLLVPYTSGWSTANADDTTATWQRAAKGRIQPSTDSKVDTIILEATTVCRKQVRSFRYGPDATGLNIGSPVINNFGRSDGGSFIDDGFTVGSIVNLNSPEDSANNKSFGPMAYVGAASMLTTFGQFTVNADDTAAIWELYDIVDTGDPTAWYLAGQALNTASYVDSILSDAELETQVLAWDDYDNYPPPVTKYVLSHRERLWCYGQVTHEVGNCDVTNNSVNVGVGGTSPDWNTEVLGAALGDSSTQWLFQRDGDPVVYEISHYDSGGSQIVLKKAYAGVTGNDVAYKIFNRANVIFVSEAGFPESFAAGVYINGPNGEAAGDITGAIGYGSRILFFSQSTISALSWNESPLVDPVMIPMSSKAGALSQRVIVEHQGLVYTMDRRGWHVFNGVYPQEIGQPLGNVLDSIDFTYKERFHACYLPDTRAIRWWVVYTGDTYPKNYVQFDVETGAWSTGTYLQAITDSRLVRQGKGLRAFLLDENGHTWWGDTGLADGCPAANSHLTGAAGSTTTVVNVSDTLPTTGVGLAGAFLSRKTAAGVTESRRISSNTAGAITVASAFTGAPATGAELWVGVIPSKLRTREFSALRGPRQKSLTGYLTIHYKPVTSARYLQVRVYEDYSASAKTWSQTGTARTGITWPGGNTRYPTTDWLVTLNSTGVASIPIGSEWKRFFSVELEIDEPDADFYLIAVECDGQALEEVGT